MFCINQTSGLVWNELITGQKRIAFGNKPARKSANGEAMMSKVSRRKSQQMENQNRKTRTTRKHEKRKNR
jgi:hypothetical protein